MQSNDAITQTEELKPTASDDFFKTNTEIEPFQDGGEDSDDDDGILGASDDDEGERDLEDAFDGSF